MAFGFRNPPPGGSIMRTHAQGGREQPRRIFGRAVVLAHTHTRPLAAGLLPTLLSARNPRMGSKDNGTGQGQSSVGPCMKEVLSDNVLSHSQRALYSCSSFVRGWHGIQLMHTSFCGG